MKKTNVHAIVGFIDFVDFIAERGTATHSRTKTKRRAKSEEASLVIGQWSLTHDATVPEQANYVEF